MMEISCFDNAILKLIHLENNVGKIFLLLLIKIKWVFLDGSSKIFNKAFTEFTFKYSILSINTNLGLVLNEDLFKSLINFLIWFMSINFLSTSISIRIKFGFDLFKTVLNEWLFGFILKPL